MKYSNKDSKYQHPEYLKLLRFLLGSIRLKAFNPKRYENVLSLPVHENPDSNPGDSEGDFALWVGHSSVLCRQDSIYYLTDPVFSERASPFTAIGPCRYSPPGISITNLPKISFVLISHNHYDHLDYRSVKMIYDRDRPRFFVPKGLSGWFESAGIDSVVEIDWYSSQRIDSLTVTSVPAQHFSARTMWDRNQSHWCGWIVSGEKKFYYSGDSGYFDGFKEIGKRYGPIDLAALPIGAYEPVWMMRRMHLNPEEALDVFDEVRGRKFLAVHWGSFDLTFEPVDEPPTRLKKEAETRKYPPGTINILRVGQKLFW
ncbi:MAG: MBL fold metallo-hydrolase [Nitrospinota bacterium]